MTDLTLRDAIRQMELRRADIIRQIHALEHGQIRSLSPCRKKENGGEAITKPRRLNWPFVGDNDLTGS